MTTLALIPIVMNAGAAVLPAILAATVSALAVLIRPSQWGRIIREKPWVPVVIVAVIGLSAGAWWLWPAAEPTVGVRGGAPGAARFAAAAPPATDWTAVALAYLRDKRQGGAAVAIVSSDSAVTTNAPAIIFRVNAQRSGYVDGPSPRNLKPAWAYVDAEDDFAQYLSSPALHGGRLYGASCTLTGSGSVGSVFCVDAATGQRRWLTYEASPKAGASPVAFKGIFSSPAVTADGRWVVVGQGLHLDRDSSLLCFDAQSGALRWQVPTPLHIEGSPAIEGDIVVAGAGAVEVGADHKPAPGDSPGFVLGVRISTGEPLWRHEVIDPESSPVIEDGIAYIGSGVNGKAVVALRIGATDDLAGRDREVWRTATDYPAVGPVTLAGDLVLVGCGKGDFVFAAPDPLGFVLALDKATGRLRWQTELPDVVLGAIAVRGQTAVVPVRNGEVVAVDLSRDGAILWRRRISQTAAVLAGPALTDTCVYAVSADGYLAVLDVKDGAILEKHYLNREGRPGERSLCVSGPVIGHGAVYVGSETGGLRAFVGGQP